MLKKFSYKQFSVTGLEFMLTQSGLSLVHKTGGYYQYLLDMIDQHKADEERKQLELSKIKHDVSISKWQYRFFIAGATAGILNLLWTVLKQFVFKQ